MKKFVCIMISCISIFTIVLLLSACMDSEDNGNNTNNQQDMSTTVDITDQIFTARSSNCADYSKSYSSMVQDVQRSVNFSGSLSIAVSETKCQFSTNAIPNHDFNDGTNGFVTTVSEQNDNYEVPIAPTMAAAVTALSLSYDNAIFLNGVKLDLLAAACYGVGDGKIGCNNIDTPWRYDPMYSGNNFGTDSHNAHTQPDGTYHYHGNPMAMFASSSNVVSPVIGFAADGFPIYGSYFDDDGTIRKATSSYRLKSGARQAVGGVNPGGNYDGTYRDDYEYVDGHGDLDQCNGMTIDGDYGYYVTDSYPWIMGCFSGTPDPSFEK